METREMKRNLGETQETTCPETKYSFCYDIEDEAYMCELTKAFRFLCQHDLDEILATFCGEIDFPCMENLMYVWFEHLRKEFIENNPHQYASIEYGNHMFEMLLNEAYEVAGMYFTEGVDSNSVLRICLTKALGVILQNVYHLDVMNTEIALYEEEEQFFAANRKNRNATVVADCTVEPSFFCQHDEFGMGTFLTESLLCPR